MYAGHMPPLPPAGSHHYAGYGPSSSAAPSYSHPPPPSMTHPAHAAAAAVAAAAAAHQHQQQQQQQHDAHMAAQAAAAHHPHAQQSAAPAPSSLSSIYGFTSAARMGFPQSNQAGSAYGGSAGAQQTHSSTAAGAGGGVDHQAYHAHYGAQPLHPAVAYPYPSYGPPGATSGGGYYSQHQHHQQQHQPPLPNAGSPYAAAGYAGYRPAANGYASAPPHGAAYPPGGLGSDLNAAAAAAAGIGSANHQTHQHQQHHPQYHQQHHQQHPHMSDTAALALPATPDSPTQSPPSTAAVVSKRRKSNKGTKSFAAAAASEAETQAEAEAEAATTASSAAKNGLGLAGKRRGAKAKAVPASAAASTSASTSTSAGTKSQHKREGRAGSGASAGASGSADADRKGAKSGAVGAKETGLDSDDPSKLSGTVTMFQCTGFGDCNMVFTRSEHLARHVRKHTGERPFRCHCLKSFSRLDNLRQHAQTVHAETPERNEQMMQQLIALHASLAASAAQVQYAHQQVLGKASPADVPLNHNSRRNRGGGKGKLGKKNPKNTYVPVQLVADGSANAESPGSGAASGSGVGVGSSGMHAGKVSPSTRFQRHSSMTELSMLPPAAARNPILPPPGTALYDGSSCSGGGQPSSHANGAAVSAVSLQHRHSIAHPHMPPAHARFDSAHDDTAGYARYDPYSGAPGSAGAGPSGSGGGGAAAASSGPGGSGVYFGYEDQPAPSPAGPGASASDPSYSVAAGGYDVYSDPSSGYGAATDSSAAAYAPFYPARGPAAYGSTAPIPPSDPHAPANHWADGPAPGAGAAHDGGYAANGFTDHRYNGYSSYPASYPSMLSTHFPTHSIGLTSSSRPSTNSTGDGSAYGPPGAPGPSGAADHLSAPPGLPSISPFSTRPNSSHGCPGSPMDRPTLPPLSSLSRPGTAGGAGGRGDEPLAVGIGATGAAAGGGGRNSISGLAGGVGGDAAIRLPSSRANSLSFGNRLPSRSGPRGDALDFHTASSSFALMNKSPAFASGPVFGGSVAGAVLEKDRLPSRGGLPVGFLGMGGTADRSRARGSAGGNVNGIATGTGAAPSSSVRTSPDDSLFQFHPPPLDRVRDDRDLKRPTDDMNDGRAHKRFATMGDAPSCGEVVAAAGGSGGGGSGLGGGRPPSRRVSIADLCGPSNGDADEADVEDALAGVGGARS